MTYIDAILVKIWRFQWSFFLIAHLLAKMFILKFLFDTLFSKCHYSTTHTWNLMNYTSNESPFLILYIYLLFWCTGMYAILLKKGWVINYWCPPDLLLVPWSTTGATLGTISMSSSKLILQIQIDTKTTNYIFLESQGLTLSFHISFRTLKVICLSECSLKDNKVSEWSTTGALTLCIYIKLDFSQAIFRKAWLFNEIEFRFDSHKFLPMRFHFYFG